MLLDWLISVSDRVSMNQSGSLNIFSSREQEYEQKAQLLKRLAYVIFCSEMDQYAKYMPDIQGTIILLIFLKFKLLKGNLQRCS